MKDADISLIQNSHILIVLDTDGRVNIWDAIEGRRLKTLQTQIYSNMGITRDGLLVGTKWNYLQFWDMMEGKCIQKIEFPNDIEFVSFVAGDQFAIMRNYKKIYIWEFEWEPSVEENNNYHGYVPKNPSVTRLNRNENSEAEEIKTQPGFETGIASIIKRLKKAD